MQSFFNIGLWLVMRCLIIFIYPVISLVPVFLNAQADTTQVNDMWKIGGNYTLTTSHVSLVNWAVGGDNTLSLNSNLGFFAIKENKRETWENSIDLGYGLIRQNRRRTFTKSDDKIMFETKHGYQINSENTQWFFSSLLTFKTQFHEGFSQSKPDSVISRFLSPGVIVIGLGIDFKPGESLSFNYVPLTGKVTFLTDSKLSEVGAYGVLPGEKIRREMGSFFNAEYNGVINNLVIESKLDLFTNYIKNFGNIDVNWQNKLEMNINKWITINYFSQLIYDHDIKSEIDINNDGVVDRVGPRVQFKSVLGIGMSINIGEKRE